jgi:hypothetical protein
MGYISNDAPEYKQVLGNTNLLVFSPEFKYEGSHFFLIEELLQTWNELKVHISFMYIDNGQRLLSKIRTTARDRPSEWQRLTFGYVVMHAEWHHSYHYDRNGDQNLQAILYKNVIAELQTKSKVVYQVINVSSALPIMLTIMLTTRDQHFVHIGKEISQEIQKQLDEEQKAGRASFTLKTFESNSDIKYSSLCSGEQWCSQE